MKTLLKWIGLLCLSLTFSARAGPLGATPRGSNYCETICAGGAFQRITNAPNSTPVHITFKNWQGGEGSFGLPAVFILNNDELRAILVWNYRIQVRTNSGKWVTVHDDYPDAGEVTRLAALSSDRITITPPDGAPWRFCILYSRGDRAGENPGTYSGNYEVISPVMKARGPDE